MDEFLQIFAQAADKAFTEAYGMRMGFAIIVFPFNASVADYVSNAERENMVQALRETADRIEKKEYIPPAQGTA